MMDIIIQNDLRLTKDGKLNLKDLKRFVGDLAGREPDDLLQGYFSFVRYVENEPSAEKFRDLTLEQYISGDDLDYHSYRKAYLAKSGISYKDHAAIKQQSRDYLKTLIWVFFSYTKGLPSWEWYYPYYYAPLMTDFADYVDHLTNKDLEELYYFPKGKPSKPFVQLLSILPAAASGNLPAPYRHLMESPQSVLVEKGYYPKPPYEVDREGKRKDHESIVLIKLVEDIGLVRKTYEKVAQRDPNYYARNTLGKPYHYRWSEEADTYTYQSSYGNIRECNVEVEEV